MSLPHSSDCPNSPIAIDTPNRRRRSSQTPSPRKTRKRKLRQSTIYKCFHALSRIRNTNAQRGLRRHTTRFTTQPNARRAQSAKVRLRHRLPATTRNHRPIARQSTKTRRDPKPRRIQHLSTIPRCHLRARKNRQIPNLATRTPLFQTRAIHIYDRHLGGVFPHHRCHLPPPLLLRPKTTKTLPLPHLATTPAHLRTRPTHQQQAIDRKPPIRRLAR